MSENGAAYRGAINYCLLLAMCGVGAMLSFNIIRDFWWPKSAGQYRVSGAYMTVSTRVHPDLDRLIFNSIDMESMEICEAGLARMRAAHGHSFNFECLRGRAP